MRERRDCKETQVCISLYFSYNFFLHFFFDFAEEKKNAFAWRLASEKRTKTTTKKNENMNENKLKSCRKILTCRSRYSEFLSPRSLLQRHFSFNSFKRILNHFSIHATKWNDSIYFLLFFEIFLLTTRDVFLKWNDWISVGPFYSLSWLQIISFFAFPSLSRFHVQNNWLLANFSRHQQN